MQSSGVLHPPNNFIPAVGVGVDGQTPIGGALIDDKHVLAMRSHTYSSSSRMISKEGYLPSSKARIKAATGSGVA